MVETETLAWEHGALPDYFFGFREEYLPPLKYEEETVEGASWTPKVVVSRKRKLRPRQIKEATRKLRRLQLEDNMEAAVLERPIDAGSGEVDGHDGGSIEPMLNDGAGHLPT